MRSFRLRVLRTVFGIAEYVAPRLAGRAAFALFCRVPRPERRSKKARERVEAARPFMMEARRHHLTSTYGSFVCHEFRPRVGRGSATVLIVHGWASRSEHMRPVVEALREQRLRVLALDLPGQGASRGGSLHMASAVAAVKTVEEWFAPLSVLVGHSFGGAVVLNAAAGSIKGVGPVAARRLVLIAAPNAMPDIFEAFAAALKLGPRTRRSFFGEVEQVTGRQLSTFVGARQLAQLSLPTLVLHAPDDREVPPQNAEALAAAGPHVRLLWLDHAGHRRILADSRALAEIGAFAAGGRLLTAAQERKAFTIS